MLGKIIGAIVGAKAARSEPGGLGGTGGALLGAAVPMVLRRFGPLGLVAVAVGGYAYKRYSDKAAKRPAPTLEEHPLVKHYGLPLDALALTKAHRRVEGSHREAAWRIVLDHIPPGDRQGVVGAMGSCLSAWLAYRDEVATACGLAR